MEAVDLRILITGGAGFIGSHLTEAYLEKGDEVYIVDDLSTGSMDNIEPFQKSERFKDKLFVHINSILSHDLMLELVGTCDVVFHLAAAVGVKTILDHPLASIQTNIKGTDKVLELCNKFKKKVLVASTSEVYGKHTHAPLLETDNIIYGPSSKFRWSYAAAKLMDEFTALAYYRTTGLPVIIARLFNTVGPRQTGRYGMVIPRFVEQALTNAPITVYGDGTQSRTFTYVKDVVWAFIKLMECDDAVGEVVNLGGTEEVTIKSLAQKIIKMAESSSRIEYIPYDQAFDKDFEDMQRRVPGIDKANNLIGFQPNTGLDEIIEQVFDYMKKSTR